MFACLHVRWQNDGGSCECVAHACAKKRACVGVFWCVCARVRAFPRPRANDVLCARVVREPVNVLRACVCSAVACVVCARTCARVCVHAKSN